MVTKLKIDISIKKSDISSICNEFEDLQGLDLQEHILTQKSGCGKYEIVFIFLNELLVSSLLNLMLENNIAIFSKEDFTESLIEIIKSGKLKDYKEKLDFCEFFNEMIKNFYLSHINKDDVLDKIKNVGVDSLSDIELCILER